MDAWLRAPTAIDDRPGEHLAGWVSNLGSALEGTPSQRDDEPVFKGFIANVRDVVASRS